MSRVNDLFKAELQIINLGISGFADDLNDQGVQVQHVDWHPPAGGNKKVLDLLDRIEKGRTESV